MQLCRLQNNIKNGGLRWVPVLKGGSDLLKITGSIPELYDEVSWTFIPPRDFNIQIEHSLISLSKWESKWCKPFLSKTPKTLEESIDYIKCMTITQNVDDDVYTYISDENIALINGYIDLPMTATTFPKESGPPNRDIVTSELIYYWMVSMNIPFECQKWHLNKLLTLIKVCSIKNSTPKKSSRREIMSRNAAINAARRQALNTKG